MVFHCAAICDMGSDGLHEEAAVPNYVDRRNENPRLKEACSGQSSQW